MEENEKKQEQNNGEYKEDRNIGMAVFILLISLTIGEVFIGAIAVDWTWPLWGIAILKAVLIVYFFMHVTRMFGMPKEEQS
jgi:hypothetical protein